MGHSAFASERHEPTEFRNLQSAPGPQQSCWSTYDLLTAAISGYVDLLKTVNDLVRDPVLGRDR
jgi:hypothetical protein